ncbi:MAG: MarR family winged helix-turn-helix transcriptional regulator [Holosporales bacterium]|jgi:DNA-binding MarR family transcriptional regulator
MPDVSPLVPKIFSAIERITTVFRATLWDDAKNLGFSPMQTQILLFINKHSSDLCTVSSLAKEFSVTKATISDAVRVLLEKEILKKDYTEDARSFCLSCTPEGSKVLDGMPQDNLLGWKDILKDLSPADLEILWRGLLLLMKSLEKQNKIPLRMCMNCKHFQKDDGHYYCLLMNSPLQLSELRLDCPEHHSNAV